jgi:hypothetical protein
MYSIVAVLPGDDDKDGSVHRHALFGMFLVIDADAIRSTFNQERELSADIRAVPSTSGIADNAKARGARPDYPPAGSHCR